MGNSLVREDLRTFYIANVIQVCALGDLAQYSYCGFDPTASVTPNDPLVDQWLVAQRSGDPRKIADEPLSGKVP